MKQFFQSRANFLSFIIALVPCILFYVFQPFKTVHYVFFAISVLLCFIALWIATMKWLDCKQLEHELSKSKFPYSFKIIAFTQGICLCTSTYPVSYNSIVSFYLKRDGFEHLIGYGIVRNIQEDQKIQLAPHPLKNPAIDTTAQSFPEFLSNNRSNIIVKPTITIDALPNLNQMLNNKGDNHETNI